jgi:hypothetical protein
MATVRFAEALVEKKRQFSTRPIPESQCHISAAKG